VIVDGAFKNVEELKRAGYSGMNHSSEPVGWFEEVKEDARGLFVRVAFHSTDDAQNCRKKIQERLAAGKEVGMSIMYRVTEWADGEREGKRVRELKGVEVVEAGFVTIPANTSAMVTAVKDGSGATLAEDFDTARELVEKVIDRIVDLKESASGDLSAGRVEIVRQLHQKCGDLLAVIETKSADDEPEMANPETVLGLAPSW
jgi:HK97 family phage prohead protease